MSLAYLVSMKSKDTSTRVGAVIVGKDNEIRSTGFNGLPRGIEDAQHRYDNKEYKYLAENHAEENAILNCARVGVSTDNCSIYTPWLPCAYCAKSIIQAGIKKVIYDVNFPGNDQKHQTEYWYNKMMIAKEILIESQVEIIPFSGELIEVSGFYRGESIELKKV
jgi:dCMP deaminase